MRRTNLTEAIISMLAVITFLGFGLFVFGADPQIPLIFGCIFIASMGVFRLKFSWSDLEESILDTIMKGMQAILILLVVGMLIGTWILSGIVPSMIYYGLDILSPSIFLVATTIICAIVSISTGSSWTTVGTIGIALVGIGQTLGMPLQIIAGAIISGAYFGDKMSPLSDTTNLAPAMAGTNLFDHIKHMLYSTVPAFLISLVLYGIIGFKYSGQNIDSTQINLMKDTLLSSFNTLSPILLMAPALVILMVVFKVPALPGLLIGTLLGGFMAIIFQGSSIGDVINVMHYGYLSQTGVSLVDDLLSRGGLDSMLWTVSLILCALSLGGMLEKTGILDAIATAVLKIAKGTFGVVFATISTCIFTNIVIGDQYLAIVVPGTMYKDEFRKRNLAPQNLSRALEDSATVTSPLIPWNTCGAYMMATLGVSPILYLPFAFFNILTPIISLTLAATGISMTKLNENNKEDSVA